jgi:hypothetical protein
MSASLGEGQDGMVANRVALWTGLNAEGGRQRQLPPTRQGIDTTDLVSRLSILPRVPDLAGLCRQDAYRLLTGSPATRAACQTVTELWAAAWLLAECLAGHRPGCTSRAVLRAVAVQHDLATGQLTAEEARQWVSAVTAGRRRSRPVLILVDPAEMPRGQQPIGASTDDDTSAVLALTIRMVEAVVSFARVEVSMGTVEQVAEDAIEFGRWVSDPANDAADCLADRLRSRRAVSGGERHVRRVFDRGVGQCGQPSHVFDARRQLLVGTKEREGVLVVVGAHDALHTAPPALVAWWGRRLTVIDAYLTSQTPPPTRLQVVPPPALPVRLPFDQGDENLAS